MSVAEAEVAGWETAAGRLTGMARNGEDWEMKVAAAGWKRVETTAARQEAKMAANWEERMGTVAKVAEANQVAETATDWSVVEAVVNCEVKMAGDWDAAGTSVASWDVAEVAESGRAERVETSKETAKVAEG